MYHPDQKGTNMAHPEQAAKLPPATTGTFATLRALLRVPPSGLPLSRPFAAFLALSVLSVLLPASASASADTRIAEIGTGAGQLLSPSGLAVSAQQGGDIYVADSENQRVDQFDPSQPPAEQFVGAFGWKVNAAPEEQLQTCTTATGCQRGSAGSGPGQLDYSFSIAVDNSCAQQEPPLTGAACAEFDPSYGDLYLVDQRNHRIEKFGPAGEFKLMFGGEVDKTAHADLCTAADLASGDTCGAGLPGAGPGEFSASTSDFNNSIAVGPDGTVYVGDLGRVQEFEPSGAFAGELKLADAEPQFVIALALDSSGNIFERSASLNASGRALTQVPGVREYSPAHALLRTFDAGPEETGSEPTHIALDAAGDLFASDHGGGEFRFRAFRPDASLYAEFPSDQVPGEFVGDPAGLALDPAGNLYAASTATIGATGQLDSHIAVIPPLLAGPPAITEQHVTDLEPTTATLHAVLNPSQFKTEYHFEYTTTDFSNCGLPANPACLKTPTVNLGPVQRQDHVQAAISNLTTNTAYHWRTVAESTYNGHTTVNGPEESFETLPPVSVRDFTTQTVGPELVVLKAELDNNNSLQAAHYTICYGKATGDYTADCSEGSLPAGSGAFEAKQATFPGLQPDTTYHYQLIAHNEYGEVKTADATFTTELSAAEERAAESSCPNTVLREENNSLALSDCRAYEMVSPPYKAGFPASSSDWLAPGGERVLYGSVGAFAGAVEDRPPQSAQYIAHRTASGWLTQPVVGLPAGPGYQSVIAEDFSPELDRWTFAALPGLAKEQTTLEASTGALYMGFLDGTFIKASPTISLLEGEGRNFGLFLSAAGQADNLSRLFIVTGARLLASDPRPDTNNGSGSETRIYEVAGADGPDPSLSLVAEVPLHLGGGSCTINSSLFGGSQSQTLASADGSILFYSVPIELHPGQPCGTGQPNPIALYARTLGAAPVQLNAQPPSQWCSSPHPCASAAPTSPSFYGPSPDGSRAWFTTQQPLVDTDADPAEGPASNDLYLAKLDPQTGQLTELIQASAGEATDPTPGQGAGVQGVVRVSPDGSHVAFVATGVLTTQPNGLGDSAAQGADNLYLYDATSGETKFVARLCSGPGLSGSLADPACPASLTTTFPGFGNDSTLWAANTSDRSRAQLTPNGRYLLLQSFARLVPDDTDNASDVYRYDFQTGRLIRLSFGRNGNDANGNDDAYPAEISTEAGTPGTAQQIADDSARSISADGSLAIFRTAAPLTSHDTNTGAFPSCSGNQKNETGCDLYEWEEVGHGTCTKGEDGSGGCVRLVSDGLDPHGTHRGNLSASGRDITFTTSRSEISADTDGVGDIYDARENGGFPRPVEPPCHVSSAHCPGPESSQPNPPTIGTETFVGPGNEPTQLKCAKGKVRVTKHGQIRCVAKKHHAKKHHKAKHKRASTNRGGSK